jgi:2-oxoglutarate dehydrogenase E2 component (dihydrolipoamide succinyltransferase)
MTELVKAGYALMKDGWFLISAAGLVVSGGMFFMLLGQYRSAADAADGREPDAEPAPATEPQSPVVRPVWTAPQAAAAPKIASVPPPKTEEFPHPDAAPAHKTESTTGGISPAVVYLQNIKMQLEELHGDTRRLAQRVDQITARDEALIERLGEIVQAVSELKAAGLSAAPAPAPSAAAVETAPAPKRAKKAEPAPEPAPAPEPVVSAEKPAALVIEPPTASGVPGAKKDKSEKKTEPVVVKAEPAPKAEPPEKLEPDEKAEPVKKALSVDETVRMELDDVIANQLSQLTVKKDAVRTTPAEAAPPAAEPAAAPASEPEPGEKPRRGPVWPV